jgi:histidyl-tRNA synthetase
MSSDKKKKIKARLPRGLADRGRAVYERYGFEAVETPAIEYTETLGKFLPDQDRPNEGVFSFQDDDEQWLSLRYDLTAPLARYVAENFQNLALPYRSYRHGWVFRNEKPGPGRFRQFMQFDADTVGSASMAADAEICMMAADTMKELGIDHGSYSVKVNNRKVLEGVLESIGLGGDANASTRLAVLRTIDKLDRLGQEGVELLLGPGRIDESGDRTPGAGLSKDQIDSILFVAGSVSVVWLPFADESELPTSDELILTVQQFAQMFGKTIQSPSGRVYYSNMRLLDHWEARLNRSEIGLEGVRELRDIVALVQSLNYGSSRVRIASDVVRGLEYYTGPVYEIELAIEVRDQRGQPVQFGSVGGGGRYDGLIARFRGEAVPAAGFSIGVSRLMSALKLLGKIDDRKEYGPVLITIFRDGSTADYQKLVATLRNAGIRAELYLGSKNHNLGQQLKYADRRNSPCAVIQGGDEKAGGKVLVRDLVAGAELAKLEQSDREDYLKKQAEAQFLVPEAELVQAVEKVLAKHGIK